MKVLFFIGDADWTARADVFVGAAHGLGARGHEVFVAAPPGPNIDGLDGVHAKPVRIDPGANAALSSFDFRRVAQERALDVVFVHTAREQLIVGSGLRLADGGRVIRRLGMFESRADEPGMITSRLAPARLLVSTNAEAAELINAGGAPPFVAPLGIDVAWAENVLQPLDRRELHLREDAIIVACPYATDGRPRLLNMMRSLALLGPRHPRLRAVVIGERAPDDDLRMQAAALGVAPLVQFVDGSKIHPVRVMKVSDFAWVTADHDAGARGCLGAMAAGKAIVAERSHTIDYFLADGINGTALPGGNPSAMAAAVADVVVRAETRVAWGHAGRSRAMRELRLETMVDGFDRAVQAADPVGAAR